jgi:transcriptional regulator with XRE-family HTH domain
MNTIGKILKDARQSKDITLSKLENITKIKKDFLIKIENEKWSELPEFTVVSGFVKNIANSLDLSVDNVNATLRRDYPPKKQSISPKPDIVNKFSWSPKLTFAVGVGLLIVLVLGYLGFEYKKFVTPPELTIISPKENQQVLQGDLTVEGKTSTDVILTVNNQLITLDQDGNFKTKIEVSMETKSLIFKAISRSGKETVIDIKISIN